MKQTSSLAPRDVPSHTTQTFKAKAHDYCVLIPIINEGSRIQNQLRQMAKVALRADVILVDGGSTDGSLTDALMKETGVRTLLTKTGPGKQSAQLRVGFDYALREGYQGIVLIDGNGKDGVEAIPAFVDKLESGYDFIQGSRYAPGGKAINTPRERHLAVKLVHAPLISAAARYWYTDTTNGFRGLSRKFLLDDRVQPFREVFSTYNLHYYLAIRAPRLGFKVCELGVTRAYPKGEIPSKISGWKGKMHIMKLLWESLTGKYNPKL